MEKDHLAVKVSGLHLSAILGIDGRQEQTVLHAQLEKGVDNRSILALHRDVDRCNKEAAHLSTARRRRTI